MAQPPPAKTAPDVGTRTVVAPEAPAILRSLDDEERLALSRRDFARANDILDERLGLKARLVAAGAVL